MLRVMELYPEQLNLNGDTGNPAVLVHRLRLAGLPARHVVYRPGEPAPYRPDMVTIGAGSKAAILHVLHDLPRISSLIYQWAWDGVPMLAVGTGMALLADEVIIDGDSYAGAGFARATVDLDAAGQVTDRFVTTWHSGTLLGTENHRSTVTLHAEEAFGTVAHGFGNNGSNEDGFEIRNVIGTHMQGPVLALNPTLADWFCRAIEPVYTPNHRHIWFDELAAQAREALSA